MHLKHKSPITFRRKIHKPGRSIAQLPFGISFAFIRSGAHAVRIQNTCKFIHQLKYESRPRASMVAYPSASQAIGDVTESSKRNFFTHGIQNARNEFRLEQPTFTTVQRQWIEFIKIKAKKLV